MPIGIAQWVWVCQDVIDEVWSYPSTRSIDVGMPKWVGKDREVQAGGAGKKGPRRAGDTIAGRTFAWELHIWMLSGWHQSKTTTSGDVRGGVEPTGWCLSYTRRWAVDDQSPLLRLQWQSILIGEINLISHLDVTRAFKHLAKPSITVVQGERELAAPIYALSAA